MGIIGLLKSAALELGKYNITVNAVIPGLGHSCTYGITDFVSRIHERDALHERKALCLSDT